MKGRIITIAILISVLFVKSDAFAQSESPITISSENDPIKSKDLMKLVVRNRSLVDTFYYSIVLKVNSDSGGVPLLSDINSLGKNEFMALKPIRPGKSVTKSVSLKEIAREYYYYKGREMKFGVMYYVKPNLRSKGSVEYLSQFKL